MTALKLAGLTAQMAEVLCDTIEERNDWKARMILAAVPALSLPDNWKDVSEEEKEIRLNRIIELLNKQ